MKNKKMLFMIMAWLLLILFSFCAHGAPQAGTKDVVFVLDASGSMKTNDPSRLAMDGMAQMIYTLPSNYHVGAVVYNTDVVLSCPPVEHTGREALTKQLEAARYADYTNAGAGLSNAVELLAASASSEKTIVLLSDGEILLDNDQATEQSLAAYQNAVDQAVKDGIKIHIIGLGSEMADLENSIFMAAVQTGGESYYAPQAVGIQKAVDAILNEQFKIKRITAAIIDLAEKTETVSISLPFLHASKVRILLTSDGPIKNLQTNFQGESAKQTNGERYSLIEIVQPKNNKIELDFSGEPQKQVCVTVIPEYSVTPKAAVIYSQGEEGWEAIITCRFYDQANEKIQLWTEEIFNQSKLALIIDGKKYDAFLKDGKLKFRTEAGMTGTKVLDFDYFGLPVNVETNKAVYADFPELPVSLETTAELASPAAEQQADSPGVKQRDFLLPNILLAAVLFVLAVIAVIWLLLCRKKNKYVQAPEALIERPEPGKHSYIGKINLYITRTKSGHDIPPLSYDLFRLPSSKVVSLAEILESCKVNELFAGAEKIYFKSGAARTIILTNHSDCTIMKTREIMMKGKSYQLDLNAKVDITFEDEISELTLQYKGLKPSEM